MIEENFLMVIPDKHSYGVRITTPNSIDLITGRKSTGIRHSYFIGRCSLEYHENDLVEINMESDVMVVPICYGNWFKVCYDVSFSKELLNQSEHYDHYFSVEENEHLFLKPNELLRKMEPKFVSLGVFDSVLKLSPNQKRMKGFKEMYRHLVKKEKVEVTSCLTDVAAIKLPWTKSIITDKRNLTISNITFEKIFGLDVLH